MNSLLNQIFRFVIVGGIATIIDWLVFRVAVYSFGINPLVGNVLSFCVSVIYNYWASCKWVFKIDKNKDTKILIAEFFGFAVVGAAITELILYIGVNIMQNDSMIMKIIGTAVSMVFNFVTRKIFLEGKEKWIKG